MLDLNLLRSEFAEHLSADPLRFSMDKALAHVCEMAYRKGLEDGKAVTDQLRTDLFAAEMGLCHRCGGEMKRGHAIAQTAAGVPDFPGGEVVTLSPGGPGRMIPCMKCADCGHSVTLRDSPPTSQTPAAS